jgi:hypothetical protein
MRRLDERKSEMNILFIDTRCETTCLADFLGVAFISIPQKLVRIASRYSGSEAEVGRDGERAGTDSETGVCTKDISFF